MTGRIGFGLLSTPNIVTYLDADTVRVEGEYIFIEHKKILISDLNWLGLGDQHFDRRGPLTDTSVFFKGNRETPNDQRD